jgi:hypothetical protein
MIYPKKTAGKDSDTVSSSKKVISKEQRDALKKMISEKYTNMYPDKDPAAIKKQVEDFIAGNNNINTATLKQLDRQLADGDRALAQTAGQPVDLFRDDVSEKSGVSKMSGASDLNSKDLNAKQNDGKSQTLLTDNRTSKSAAGKTYRNDEEEWADIYKTNNAIYKQEKDLVKVKTIVEKDKFREELDAQVKIKQEKKRQELEQVKIDAEQIKKRVEKEEEKEKKKTQAYHDKIMYEKKLRDEQLKEIVKSRKHEVKQAKQLDKFIVENIKREKQEEEEEIIRKRQADLAAMKKVLEDNEVKRLKAIETSKQERDENIKLQEMYSKMVEQQEAQRAADFKAKEDRINAIIEQGKNAKVVVTDEREKRQLAKVAKHEAIKEKKLTQIEQDKLAERHRRNMENKAYLDQQVVDKHARKKDEKDQFNEQARVWKSENEQYAVFLKDKEEAKVQKKKEHVVLLKKQIIEKHEEKKIGNLLLSMRDPPITI